MQGQLRWKQAAVFSGEPSSPSRDIGPMPRILFGGCGAAPFLALLMRDASIISLKCRADRQRLLSAR